MGTWIAAAAASAATEKPQESERKNISQVESARETTQVDTTSVDVPEPLQAPVTAEPTANSSSRTSADASDAHESWDANSAETPDEIVANGGLMSMLFGSEIEPAEDDEPLTSRIEIIPSTTTQESLSSSSGVAVKPLESFASLCERWPVALEERRRICYLPPPEVAAYYERTRTRTPCILYWMRNTLRVTHGNFALESALLLAQRLDIPLMTVCLVPSATVYPTCHASNVNDAFSRWSYADVQQQFQHAGLPFFGITWSTAPKKAKATNTDNGSAEGGYPLFQLFDWFAPYLVVTDDACDLAASRDLDQLTQFLRATRASSSWGLLTVDSEACVPIYSRLAVVQRTLITGERYLGEDAFSRAYSEYHQKRSGEAYAFTQIEKAGSLVADFGKCKRDGFSKLLRQLQLEEVDWRVVEALSVQSSPEMAPFSEMDALKKLDRLLAESSDRPAIQAELQVGRFVTAEQRGVRC